MKQGRVLVTAGPTREPIDSVRFISNYSSGFMGYSIARQAKARGYEVTLITGPTSLELPAGIKVVAVNSASDMFRAVKEFYRSADIIIMAAAVCDFRPSIERKRKIKPKDQITGLALTRNPDILHWLGKNKKKRIRIRTAQTAAANE